MTKADEKRKAEAVYKMGIAFDKEMSKMQISVYLESLLAYTPEQVERGVNVLIRTHEMGLPKVATLLKAIEETELGYINEETLKLAAEAEWTKLREMVPRIGIYRTPKFDDPTTAEVVRMMGGWSAQCNMREDEKPFRRKEFVELWTQIHGREDQIALGASGVIRAQKKMAQLGRGVLALSGGE